MQTKTTRLAAVRKTVKQVNYLDWAKRWGWVLFRALLVTGLCFIILYPIILKLSVVFRSRSDMYDPTVLWIPKTFTWDNVLKAIEAMDYWVAFKNTFLLSLGTTVLQVIACGLAAYAFARLRFRGSGILFMLVVFTIVVPPSTIMIPTYLTYRYFDFFGLLGLFGLPEINLIDTVWPFVLSSSLASGLKNGLYIYIFRQFFRGIPKDLEEAAYVDGCGIGSTFFRIILPNAVPAIVTVSLFSFVWQWNDSYYVSMFFNKVPVLSTQLSAMSSTIYQTITNEPVYVSMILNTGILLVMAPLIIMYLFVQRYFVESVERTGIVG
jgi:multiple sugar transport system permease protein